MEIKEKILASRLIAVIRGVAPGDILNVVGALFDGGVRCAEVTFDARDSVSTPDTLRSIELMSAHFPGLTVGAGTVLSSENASDAFSAGARFMVSPNSDREVIRRTKQLGAVSIPGALTPTEAINAHKDGADIVKLFPAGDMGIKYMKSVTTPLSHIPFFAVGGITPENILDFIAAGAKGAGVSGRLINKAAIAAGDFIAIKNAALEYTALLK